MTDLIAQVDSEVKVEEGNLPSMQRSEIIKDFTEQILAGKARCYTTDSKSLNHFLSTMMRDEALNDKEKLESYMSSLR